MQFDAVAPRASSVRPSRAFLLGSTMVMAVVALVALGNTGDHSEPVPNDKEIQSLDFSQKTPAIAPAGRDPTSSLPVGAIGQDSMDLLTHANARWNYQMDNTLTWPPHDTDYIPTGAYSRTYKGPYDNDYDWPDDTEVMRNDEWDKSGGIGCGMSGNNC
jgi:hypothetical protein